ncbi:MAG: 3-phosphoshikimate 1-carboxyvinyltransferase [Deltaproteobacteria bacterium]
MSLNGVFSPPGDKSICHRLALMSLLARGEMRLMNFSPGADVASSLEAVRNLAGGVRTQGEHLIISGARGEIKDRAVINCGNSGTTMRLLMGILAGRAGRFILDGDSSLRRRPMERVASPLRDMGAAIECVSGACPVTVEGGGLQGIDYELPVASAQLKSAVLLAGIQAEGVTSVRGQVRSRDHTERLLQDFRARISWNDSHCTVERSSLELPDSYRVPGDISSAAFFLCAAAIIPGSEVTAEGVLLNPTRTGFLNALSRMGAEIEVETEGERPEPWGRVTSRFSSRLTCCSIGPDEIPFLVDEVPILALVAARAHGTSVFEGVGELRVKESDRLAAVASQLNLMGANVVIDSDTLVVHGPAHLRSPRKLESFGDHRIAMTLRLAALLNN